MKLKLCGVRTPEMAKASHDLKIDFVGFNFVDQSRRRIYEDEFESIANLTSGVRVGVFQNASLQAIENILAMCELDILQLHGNEPPQLLQHFASRYEIWKAFSLSDNFSLAQLKKYSTASAFLFDGPMPGKGEKTSQNILGKVVQQAQKMKKPFGIAGGITPENIVSFKKNFPHAFFLDTASGVEKNGVFSREKLEKLVQESLINSSQ
ncbi:phosphoribosylanthranilate isomerase [Candidatus Gracilibacteria bacterium]|nr:phosphoribosylanthranilate isomerase [Candidatus Gracilibacteria bacterium]